MAEVWYRKRLREQEEKINNLEDKLEKGKKKLEDAEREIRHLKNELGKMGMTKEAKRPHFPDYSLRKHERSLVRHVHKSTGRIPFSEKLKNVQFETDVYPKGVPSEKCVFRTNRIVTHLGNGQKEVWLYHIYRKSWGKATGKLPQVFGKSEYGVDVVMALAFLVYVLKLSQDQARSVLAFFTKIELSKSETESLLKQLGKEWEKEQEVLADLILLAMVVYMDETGWKIGKKNCYTWIFKSALHTLLLYGERRNEEVLDRILPRGKFKGVGISDCYKIYEKRFTAAQKCWAHFLRKAIKLMLLYPEKKQYHEFFKTLYAIFLDAKALKLEDSRKEIGIDLLEKKIEKLCVDKERRLTKLTLKDEREFVNLQKNLTRNLKDLFTFVRIEGVDPTNNDSEQNLRSVARSRNNYQTSKSKAGAKRHGIITSVFYSLKQNLKEFTMQSITEEVIRWQKQGKSLFTEQLESLQAC